MNKKQRFALVLIAFLTAAMIFDMSSSGVLARIAAPDSANYATATNDILLREQPKLSSPRILAIKPGQKLQLVDSAGGEVLDGSAAAPSKWYLVKLPDTGDTGWVYSTWIKR
jgi:hypothetical protein